MSKLFDILSSGKGEIADLVRPLAGAEPKPAPQSASPDAPHEIKTPPVIDPGCVRTLSLRVPAPSPLLPFENDQQRASEQYRILRTRIVQDPKQPRVLMFSSPSAGDGKSVTTINMAATLSLKTEADVLLLDADFRRSAVHAKLGLPESPGLAEVLQGACTPAEALIRTQEFPKLFVMTAGQARENPVELLDSGIWRELCSTLRRQFRYIVMDSPPVGAVADYDLIQAACDAVVLVVRPDHTNRALCKKALETVPRAKFMGVLLNCIPEWSFAKRAGSDYYYYGGENTYR